MTSPSRSPSGRRPTGSRLTGARFWIEILTGKEPLRPGLSHVDAVDVLWLLMSPDNYYLRRPSAAMDDAAIPAVAGRINHPTAVC